MRIIKSKALKSLLIITIALFMLSCVNSTTETTKEVIYPVEVEIVKTSKKTKQLEYFGIINSQIINYSFTMSGKVDAIFVNKNQYVTKGTKLIQLETSGLKLALNAAKHQTEQAQSAYQESERYFKNLKKAYESGGISESDLDKARLDMDVKEQDFQQAKINHQSKLDDLNHATLISLSDGTISDIIPKKGEIIEAGAETIVIQGNGFFAETAISQKDMDNITIGAKAIIEYKNQKMEGNVAYISSLPDFQTFRHSVKIIFSGNESKVPAIIGQTIKVFIDAKTIQGIWIPVKYIFNDGENYVNVAENNRLRKKRVHIIDFSDDKVRVDGLIENEQLIIRGAANINEGFKVTTTNN